VISTYIHVASIVPSATQIAESFNRAMHLPAYPRRASKAVTNLPEPCVAEELQVYRFTKTLNPALDFQQLQSRYLENEPSMHVVIDDLLERQTLEQLYEMCLESTFWFDPKVQVFEAHSSASLGQSWPRHEAGYLGAYDFAGFNQPLLMQVAEDIRSALPAVIGSHKLIQVWAYKYDSSLEGVQVHADDAAINVNLWLTPSSANLDPETGALHSMNVVATSLLFNAEVKFDPYLT
jgi:hypothetical protein